MQRWRTAMGLLLAMTLPAAAQLNDDGLHEQPWFLHSFLELPDDWHAAAESGRHFVVLWELKGCPLCQRLHQQLLSDPDIASYMRQHFDVLQLNLIGSRKVLGFDRQERTEKDLARQQRVEGTPSMQIYAISTGPQAPREVLRIRGLPDRARFMTMLRYVQTRAYEHQSYDEFSGAASASATRRSA